MEARPSPILRVLRRTVLVEAGEIPLLGASFGYFFLLLGAYYILRPLRESAGIAGDDPAIPWLFLGTFVTMLVAVPIYSAAVSRFPRRVFVPWVYHFFTWNLVLFVWLHHLLPDRYDLHVGYGYFIWLSVFNLFGVSVFWSMMAERYSQAQGKRLFGCIAAGGSLGGVCGSRITALFAESLGRENLILISALLVQATVLLVLWVVRLGRRHPPIPEAGGSEGSPETVRDVEIGGGIWAGFVATVRSRYLLAISGYLLCGTLAGTFLYSMQADLVHAQSTVWADRTRIFARIDTFTLLGTLVVQLFLISRTIRWIGIGATLGILPLVCFLGFSGLGFAPWLVVLVVFQAFRRTVGYAVAKPARETLFTTVPLEEKYKAKSFIDTVVYRGGDSLSAGIYSGLARDPGPGLGPGVISFLTLPLCIAWLGLGLFLGRRSSHPRPSDR